MWQWWWLWWYWRGDDEMNLILWHCTARGCHLHKGYDNVEPWNVKGANEYFVINSFLYMFIFVHSQNLIHQKEWIDLLWSLMASQRSNQSCQKTEDGRGPIRKRMFNSPPSKEKKTKDESWIRLCCQNTIHQSKVAIRSSSVGGWQSLFKTATTAIWRGMNGRLK